MKIYKPKCSPDAELFEFWKACAMDRNYLYYGRRLFADLTRSHLRMIRESHLLMRYLLPVAAGIVALILPVVYAVKLIRGL